MMFCCDLCLLRLYKKLGAGISCQKWGGVIMTRHMNHRIYKKKSFSRPNSQAQHRQQLAIAGACCGLSGFVSPWCWGKLELGITPDLRDIRLPHW